MRTRYLVCYDIADPSRLAKVFRLLKAEGQHVQYSVFLCSLTWPALQTLKSRLNAVIDHGHDDIRLYPLPSRTVLEVLGQAELAPEGVEIMVDGGPFPPRRLLSSDE